MTHTTSVRSHALPVGVLLVVCLAVFSNTFTNELVWDDPVLITENRHIRDHKNIPRFFTPHYFNNSYPVRGLYRPVRELSLAVDYWFWGTNPLGYHVTNLCLHAINVVLIFYLVYIIAGKGCRRQGRETGDRLLFVKLPFLTALFFATHPIHTESLNLIKNRSDLLAFLFFLLSFLLFIKYLGGSNRMARRLLIIGAWLCFVPALLSKEMALTLPGVLALYAVSFSPGQERKKALILIIPYGVIILAYFWFVRSFISPHETAADLPLPAEIGQQALTTIKTMGCYVKLLIAPLRLNVDHAFVIPESVMEFSVLLSLMALLLIFIVAARAYQRSPIVFFALGWILLTLLPAANIIYLASRPIAEQRLYIPSFGFCLVLGYGVDRLRCAGAKSLKPGRMVAVSGILAVVISGLYAVATVRRNADWSDNVTFYSSTVAANPKSVRMNYNFGNALREAKKYEEAITHYQAALSLKPDYLIAHYNLGMTFYEAGRYDDAIARFQAVLSLDPDHVAALNNVGVAFYDSGRLEEAIPFFRDALRIAPEDVSANWNLGDALVDLGRPEEAISHYLTVLRRQPDCLSVYSSLGKIFMDRGEMDKAIGVYADALALYPDNAGMHDELNRALAEKDRTEGRLQPF